MPKYEYKFVRLGESRVFGAGKEARQQYRDVVRSHAQDGWRLVQVFAPGTAVYGTARYFEVILERELPEGTEPVRVQP